jgi:hypothetical protein
MWNGAEKYHQKLSSACFSVGLKPNAEENRPDGALWYPIRVICGSAFSLGVGLKPNAEKNRPDGALWCTAHFGSIAPRNMWNGGLPSAHVQPYFC